MLARDNRWCLHLFTMQNADIMHTMAIRMIAIIVENTGWVVVLAHWDHGLPTFCLWLSRHASTASPAENDEAFVKANSPCSRSLWNSSKLISAVQLSVAGMSYVSVQSRILPEAGWLKMWVAVVAVQPGRRESSLMLLAGKVSLTGDSETEQLMRPWWA